MIYLFLSSKREAKIIIEYLNLKKSQEQLFDIYENDYIKLIISGTGKIKMSASITYLLKDKKINLDDYFINIGICGSVNKNLEIGSIFECNKILDNDTKKEFYPDMILKNNLSEKSLETFSYPLKCYSNDIVSELVDMEASAFFEIAQLFAFNHQIKVLKIVSDYLEIDEIRKNNFVEELFVEKMPIIKIYLEKIQELKISPILDNEEKNILFELFEKYKFTDYQIKELNKNIQLYKIKNKSINLKKIINDLNFNKPNNKIERKKIFDNFKRKFN